MTDAAVQTNETKAEAKTETPPAVDAAQITKDATDSATKAAVKAAQDEATKVAVQKLEMIGKALVGDEGAGQNETILRGFVNDPVRTLATVKEAAKKEIREEMAQRDQFLTTQKTVATPFLQEFPEVNTPNRLAMVEKLTENYEAQGKPYAEALKLGFEETVKELKLTSVSEAQRTGAALNVGLPGGGGVVPGYQKHDEAKSNADFLSGMKAKMNSQRVRK